eukprot:2960339-Prymnesium_polylepis.1
MNLAGGNHNTVMSDDVLAGGARESHVRSRLSAYRLAGSDQPRTTLPVRRVVRRVAEPTAGTTTPSRPPGVSAAGCRLAVPGTLPAKPEFTATGTFTATEKYPIEVGPRGYQSPLLALTRTAASAATTDYQRQQL